MSFKTLIACALLGTVAAPAAAGGFFYDPTFAANQPAPGWLRGYFLGAGQDEKGIAIARTADGGFVLALGVPLGVAGQRIGLIKLGPNGIPATGGFGTSGRVLMDAGLSTVTDMILDAQGRILVAGAIPGAGGLKDFAVVRFLANGSIDTSFSSDGIATVGFEASGSTNYLDDQPTALLVQPSGRIVVAGNSAGGTPANRFAVARLSDTGLLDHSFGTLDDGFGGRRGTLGTYVDGRDAYASRLVLADGSYLIVGTSVYSATDTDFAVRWMDTDGGLFVNGSGAPAGAATFGIDEPGPGGSLYDTASGVAVSTDGRSVVVAGTASGHLAAMRFVVGGLAHGLTVAVDASFVGSAIPGRAARFVSTLSSYGNTVTLRSDGEILIAGRYVSGGGQQYGLLQYLHRDGSIDTSQPGAGELIFGAPVSSSGSTSWYTEFNAIVLDAGRPVLYGSSQDATASGGTSDLDAVAVRVPTDLIFTDDLE